MSAKKPLVPQTAWGRLVEAAPEEGVQPLKNAKRIETRLIDADPRQPRKVFDEGAMQELIASVEQRGILQPITVQADGRGRYFIVTGERRWRAALAAGLETVPAIVVDLTEPELRLDRVIENRQRADLSDMEFADALEEIREDLGARAPNLTSNEMDEHVGERLGISGRTVRSFIALNNLPAEVKALLGPLRTELRTRGLARLRDQPERQMGLAEAVVEHQLSGRQTVAAAQLLKRQRGLSVAEAVAQVVGVGAAAEEGASETPRPAQQAQYRQVRELLQAVVGLIRQPDPATGESVLGVVEVVELHALLEPLAALFVELGPVVERVEQERDVELQVRLSEMLAAPLQSSRRPALYPVRRSGKRDT
jgi:ParB family chromosome partitioning protein